MLPEAFQEGDGPFVFLFSESAGRVLVAVPRTEESRFTAMCQARGLPATRIGVVDQGSDSIEVQGRFRCRSPNCAPPGRPPCPSCSAEPGPMTATVDRVEGRQPPGLGVVAGAGVRLDFVGIVFGALFFCASLTPSLLPRDWLFAGIVGGLNAAVGYGSGGHRKTFSAAWYYASEAGGPSRAVLWWLKALTVVGSIGPVHRDGRPGRGMAAPGLGVDGNRRAGDARVLPGTGRRGAVRAAVVAVSRVVLDAIRLLARILIRRWHVNDEVALFIGTAVVVVLILTLVNGVLFRGFLAGASGCSSRRTPPPGRA